MNYTVELTTAAKAAVRALDKGVARRVREKLLVLEENARPAGCKKLVGEGPPPVWRVRAGDWRLLYQIDDERRHVLVTEILPRDQAYR